MQTLTAYAPLGSGDRPGRLKVENEPILLQEPAIIKLAKRLKQNLSAAELSLTREDMLEMAGFNRNRRYISGTFWAMEGGPYTIANIWDE